MVGDVEVRLEKHMAEEMDGEAYRTANKSTVDPNVLKVLSNIKLDTI